MLGIKQRSFSPLPLLCLDNLVPQNHFYRQLEQQLDLSFVRDLVEHTYKSGGRPSIDPVVFFKLQLIMFFENLRSERQLLKVVEDRLSLRWYLGYDFTEPLPDHSSLTKIRHRYGLEVFRQFFDKIVEQCLKAGLVWGHDLYFDATKVLANASLDSAKPRFAVALQAHLHELFSPTTSSDHQQLQAGVDKSACEVQAQKAQSHQPEMEVTSVVVAPKELPVSLTPSEREELVEHNSARHDWIELAGQQNRQEKHGHYQRKSDFIVSTTDPDASIMKYSGRAGSHYGYHTHYGVDGGKARVIVSVLVTPSEVMENQPVLDLLWRLQFRWKLRPCQFTGDTAYGTAEIIKALEDANIRAYVPLPDWDNRTPFFSKSKFSYQPQEDVYRCPQGKVLEFLHRDFTPRLLIYRAKAEECNSCALKSKCTDSPNGRAVSRSFDEEYLDKIRSYHPTAPYKKAMQKRKVWVEPLFGEAKDWHGLRRFRLRGLEKVNCEALMTASGQNIKRLIKSWRGGKGAGLGNLLKANSASFLEEGMIS